MKSYLFLLLALVACDDSTPAAEAPRTGGEDASPPPGDASPPSRDAEVMQAIQITAPVEGAVIVGRFVDVEGEVQGPTQVVTVNDEPANVAAGRFTARLELASGSHEIIARAGGVEDRVRITVDAAPPRIDITAPSRATWQPEGQTDLEFTITDDAGLAEVLFDGDLPVDSGLAPDFALSGLPLTIGWNLLRLEASDAAGNRAREHVSVLHGALQDPNVPVPAALRLHIGPAGIDGLEAVALAYLANLDLVSLLPNPLFEEGIFRAEISSITYADPPILELTPTPGRLLARLRLEEVVITLGLLINGNEAYQVGAGAAAIEINGALVPRVENGQISIRLEDLDIAFTDLEVQAGGVPQFEDNPEQGRALIEEVAGQAVALLADRFLPDLVARLLDRIDDPIELELLGAQLVLELIPDIIVVSARGLSARIGIGVTLNNPPAGEPALAGYVTTRTPWDGVPDTDGLGLALDDDLINLLLYQVWRAGVLFPRLDAEADLGQANLVLTLLGNLVRRANPELAADTPIAVATRLPLPPVVRVGKENNAVGLILAVGDLVVDVDTDDAAARDVLEGAASLELTAAVGVTAGEEPGTLALDLNVTQTVAAFDVTTPALRGEAENSVEDPLNDLLGRLGGLLPALLSDLPIPALDFVRFVNLRADAVGPDGSFIGIFGDVAPP